MASQRPVANTLSWFVFGSLALILAVLVVQCFRVVTNTRSLRRDLETNVRWLAAIQELQFETGKLLTHSGDAAQRIAQWKEKVAELCPPISVTQAGEAATPIESLGARFHQIRQQLDVGTDVDAVAELPAAMSQMNELVRELRERNGSIAGRLGQNWDGLELTAICGLVLAGCNLGLSVVVHQRWMHVEYVHGMLQEQALRDGLTGVFNRAAIMEILRKEMARAQRQNLALSVVMIDVDHFKSINDRYGHLGGDAVLRQLGTRLRESVRAYDSVGRYGGEEFLVVVPGCHPSDAHHLARRLREAARMASIDLPQVEAGITFSAGVCSIGRVTSLDAEELVRTADQALYEAKRKGRNREELVTLPTALAS